MTPAEQEMVVAALTDDSKLARAWALKEGLRAVYKKRRHEDAQAALGSWIREAQASGLRPFQRAGTTEWQAAEHSYTERTAANASLGIDRKRLRCYGDTGDSLLRRVR